MRQAEKEIFADALELEPGERRAFVESRCAGDRGMLDRLLRLLDFNEKAGGFMAAPTLDHPGEAAGDEPLIGSKIGAYQLESVLGEGGFGRVYLARQDHPVSRVVAVKILKPGLESPGVIARLEAERQTLAMMEHPNIARIFDAGKTRDGRPYFVMEHVRGEPLTAYSRRAGLSVRQRLALFERVCLAVQHAHQKGVIHRDLKPSNVLVAEVDGRPEPRVIDFGIAKAVESQHEDATMLTLAGHIVGTPAYMSPEQFAGPGGLDTRSDVYSLGVMLYELLTGMPPFDRERLSGAPIASMARVICEEEPARPSSRVLQAEGAERRDRHLAATLRGDLDWIVMRAMEKDPDRRYPSANALARDIRRFLADEPVEAGPPSAAYRFGKFARRHRAELAAAGVALAALVALLVSSVFYGLRAESQRRIVSAQLEKATEFAEFSRGMLSGLDPAVARGADQTLLLKMLEDSIARVDASPPESPEVEAEVRELLGTGLFKIAAFEAAAGQFELALAAARASFGEQSERTLRLWASLGETLAEMSAYDEARRELTALLEVQRSVLGDDHAETATTKHDLGMLHRLTGDHAGARSIFEQVVDQRIRLLGDEHPDTMSARNSLATVLAELDRHAEAIVLLERVAAWQAAELGDDHPHTMATKNNLANAYLDVGRTDEGVAMLEELLEAKRRVLGPQHPSLITALNNLASAYGRVDRADEARPMLEEAVAICRTAFGESDRRTLILTGNLAGQLVRGGEPTRALGLLTTALPLAEQTLGRDHQLLLSMLANLVRSHLELGDPEDALAAADDLVRRAGLALPQGHALMATALLLRGECLLRAGRPAEALPLLRDAVARFGAGPEADTDRATRAAGLLAEAEAATGPDADQASRVDRSPDG